MNRTRLHLRPILLSASMLPLALAGCGLVGSPGISITAGGDSSAVKLGGRVMGGQQPVSLSSIQLYAVSANGDGTAATPLLATPATTNVNGYFSITGQYTCPSPSPLVYITATGGNPGLSAANPAIALMTALGTCSALTPSTSIAINEVTTVAAVTALAPFMSSYSAVGSSTLDAAGLATAFTMANSLASSSTGASPGASLPANATAPQSTIYTVANILAACINSTGSTGTGAPCGTLFASTTPTGGTAPTDTISAALNMMRDPQANVTALYGLSSSTAPFQPQLSTAPADWTIALSGTGAPAAVPAGCSAADLTGSGGFTSFAAQQPQVCRKLTEADLPAPYVTASSTNYSTLVARAAGQMPIVPPGFKVTLYATGFSNARYLLAVPNGDLLLSEPGGGDIKVLRGVDANGAVVTKSTYATGLTSPYGMALYPSAANPQYLYVANTSTLVRFPYTTGNTVASAAPTTLASDIPNSGNHTTRALGFTHETTPRLLISVGSASNYTNTDTDTNEFHRADILAYSLDGAFQSIFASGLRNPVGLAVDGNGTVWTSVNERDGLGDNVPAEYVTHVQEGGFYGWPWYYNGGNAEPRLPNSHPELKSATLVGDTLLQPHFAPLQINFYTGTQFPTPYRGDLFVASHGSWNKALRAGYELVRVRVVNGVATGEYEDFMTGFVNADGTVWGRPAGVVTGADGALYVADDASNSVWRITYTGK